MHGGFCQEVRRVRHVRPRPRPRLKSAGYFKLLIAAATCTCVWAQRNNREKKGLVKHTASGPRRPPHGAVEYSFTVTKVRYRRQKGACTASKTSWDCKCFYLFFETGEYVGKQGTAGSVGAGRWPWELRTRRVVLCRCGGPGLAAGGILTF